MRVMPSVTDTMVPTLRASVDDLKFSIRCLMRSLISVALMAITDSSVVFVYAVSSVAMRSSRVRREPSITRSPARRTAPPISVLSVSQCSRTWRFNLRASASLNDELLLLVERRGGGDRDVDDAFFGILQLTEDLARSRAGSRDGGSPRGFCTKLLPVLAEVRRPRCR